MTDTVKPSKPYPDFPLYAHAKGRWAKTIHGKTYYFGTWDDPYGALEEYRVHCLPKIKPIELGLSVKSALDRFLGAKEAAVNAGSLAPRSFTDYSRTLKRFAEFIGRERSIQNLKPSDFLAYKTKHAKTNNPVAVGNEITRIKSCLNWLVESKLIEKIDCGPDFVKPSAVAARRHKREMGEKLFTPEDIRAILDEAGYRMRAMILLGINCAYHNSDVETLTLRALQAGIKTGIIEHTRSKTEIERACPLWDETIEALRQWVTKRPDTESKLAFILRDGRKLSTTNGDVSKRFRVVRDAADVRDGGFSWLRKTFATYASETGDQVAVNFIMGHVDGSTSGVYRQLIREHRLHKATDAVRDWLYR